jgi:heptosyltransferase IV
VLYLRYDRIGDMILSTGLIRAIARSPSNVIIDVLASPANAPVLDGNPYVGSVIIADRRRPLSYLAAFRRIRRTRYDAILDCQVFSPSTTTLIMMLLSGARRRVGLDSRGIDAALTDPAPRQPWARHYVEHLASLAIPFGVDPASTDWRPEVRLSDAELAGAETRWRSPRRRLLVNISAGKASRRWPEDRFAVVIAALAARADLDIVIIAAPADAASAERLAAPGARFERTPRMRDALALVATADVVLTGDTSICHAASAFGKPAVAMFPRNRAVVWGPYRTAGQTVVTTEATLVALPVETVLAALDAMLNTARAPLETASDAT